MNLKREQAISNAVASAEMEGLHPTQEDIALIEAFVEKRISHDEFISTILALSGVSRNGRL